MAVSTNIPEAWRIPLFWANVDGSMAGTLTETLSALLVGQVTTAGTLPSNLMGTAVAIGSAAQAQALFGAGSMLAAMVEAFFAVNTTQLLYCLPVADPSGGVKAAGSISISSAPTASGVLSIYITDQLVQITVGSTDTPSTIATNLTAAINAIATLPVTAALDGTNNFEVDLTCNWKGLTGNDIEITPNYLGVNGGQVLPAGLTLTIVAMASGAGEPIFTSAIAAIQMQEFDFVGFPYTDTGSQAAWATEYGFGSGGRWNYTRQQYGFCVNASRFAPSGGDNGYAAAITWGLSQNAPVISTMVIEASAPSPVWNWAAAYCAAAALGFSDDPARPLQTLELTGLLPAPLQSRFSQTQLNNLANSGLAIQAVAPDGNPMIMREQTQYQLNSYGQSDSAFGLLTILATLAEILRRLKSSITTKYPRVKLVPDGTRLGPGQAAVSPSIVAAELVAEYAGLEYDGLATNIDVFKANLVVEIDDQNPNRLNVLYPPQLAGQLRQFAALCQYRLLSPISAN